MRNNNTMGLIFSGNSEVNLGELMRLRSLAAVPVGGRYRIVDFVLSNMVNSGIINVGITTGYKHRSLSDHLGSGKDWDMARKETGLFLLSPPEGVEVSMPIFTENWEIGTLLPSTIRAVEFGSTSLLFTSIVYPHDSRIFFVK